MFLSLKEEVLAPHPENDDVVNDFDIEEEVIEVENRFYIFTQFVYILSPHGTAAFIHVVKFVSKRGKSGENCSQSKRLQGGRTQPSQRRKETSGPGC